MSQSLGKFEEARKYHMAAVEVTESLQSLLKAKQYEEFTAKWNTLHDEGFDLSPDMIALYLQFTIENNLVDAAKEVVGKIPELRSILKEELFQPYIDLLLKHNDIPALEEAFKLISKLQFRLTTRILTVYINAYAKHDFVKSKYYFNLAVDRKFKPTIYMNNALLSACYYSKDLNAADELLQSMDLVNSDTYAIIMHHYCNGFSNIDPIKYQNEMLEKGIEHNKSTIHEMITHYCNGNNKERLLEMIEQVNGKGLNLLPETIDTLYSTLYYMQEFEIIESLAKYLLRFKKCALTTMHLEVVVTVCCLLDNPNRGWAWVTAFRKKGVKLNTGIFSALMLKFGQKGSSDVSLNLYKYMTKQRIPPDYKIFLALVGSHAHEGQWEIVLKFLKSYKLFDIPDEAENVVNDAIVGIEINDASALNRLFNLNWDELARR